MTPGVHEAEIRRLVNLLAEGTPTTLGAIPWASPVMMFGNLLKSRVATLGLNPSNLEFEEPGGVQLHEPLNRFETLKTLRLKDWSCADNMAIDRIWNSCDHYFRRRPYDIWFKSLDRVLNGLRVSYYYDYDSGTACHLDLVPFATGAKWSSLNADVRQQLVTLGAPTLAVTLAESTIRVLILNGASVVRAFERLMDVPLEVTEMAAWRLRRSNSDGIRGFAYSGVVSTIGGIDLGRTILVLGYNHNIQSSFGVTAAVVRDIGSWIAKRAEGAVA